MFLASQERELPCAPRCFSLSLDGILGNGFHRFTIQMASFLLCGSFFCQPEKD